MRTRQGSRAGFTLAELMVVIVIIELFLLIERRNLLNGVLEFMDSEDRPAAPRSPA